MAKTYCATLLFSILSNIAMACSCPPYIFEFCDALRGYPHIVLAEVVDSINFERRTFNILENIRGNLDLGEIIVEGQDGVNCGEWMDKFSIGDTAVFALREPEYSWPIDSAYLDGFCGRNYLDYSNGKLFGEIYPGVIEMDYQDFVENISDCLSFTSTSNQTLSNLEIYPNPVSDKIKIISPDASLDQVEIYSASGQKVLQPAFSSTNALELDFSELSRGMYFVRIRIDEEEVIRKVSKL